MSTTNFAKLTDEQYTIWSRDLWKHAREKSFVNQFVGTGTNSIIQRVTDLKRDAKGARAVFSLLADLEGDGVIGDRQLEGNEEAMKSFDQVITIDQIRHANRHEGRMADQKAVINFRENSRDVLAYWLADRIDQLAFLTMSGVSYAMHNNGRLRVGSDFKHLEFAKDITAPTSQRVALWDGTAKNLVTGLAATTSSVTATDTPTWELFVQLRAFAKDQYLRGVRGDGGYDDTYHVFLTPQAMAKLKLDKTFMENVRHAAAKGDNNKLFSGGLLSVDGIVFHEHRYVYNTSGAASGAKWGAAGTVDGCQMLFCGAQALAMADLGSPLWVEKEFDYDNQPGISVAKILGFKKPQFQTIHSGNTVQDFGVISVYVAQ